VEQAEVERREAAHREAADVGLGDLQAVEHAPDVLAARSCEYAFASSGTSDGGYPRALNAIARSGAREAHLQVPAPVVTGELVHEDQRQALTRLFVMDV